MAGESLGERGGSHGSDYRLVLAVGVVGHSRQNVGMQRRIAEVAWRLMGDAADTAWLDRPLWVVQNSGDSFIAVLPELSGTIKISTFVRALDDGVRAYNHDCEQEARLRLRVAVHFGLAVLSDIGFVGPAQVEVRRILDHAALREALVALPDVDVVLGISADVINLVMHRGTIDIPLSDIREMGRVEKSESRGRVWIWIPSIQSFNGTYHLRQESRIASEQSLAEDEAAAVAHDSGAIIDRTLARLFYRLGPPPDPTDLNNEPVSSGDGGARQ